MSGPNALQIQRTVLLQNYDSCFGKWQRIISVVPFFTNQLHFYSAIIIIIFSCIYATFNSYVLVIALFPLRLDSWEQSSLFSRPSWLLLSQHSPHHGQDYPNLVFFRTRRCYRKQRRRCRYLLLRRTLSSIGLVLAEI